MTEPRTNHWVDASGLRRTCAEYECATYVQPYEDLCARHDLGGISRRKPRRTKVSR